LRQRHNDPTTGSLASTEEAAGQHHDHGALYEGRCHRSDRTRKWPLFLKPLIVDGDVRRKFGSRTHLAPSRANLALSALIWLTVSQVISVGTGTLVN
jgi:hypothetical protein